MARTVDVYFKGHDRDLGLAIKDVKAQLATLRDTSIEVRVDVDDAGLDKLKADLAALRDRRVRISTAVDQAGLSTLRAQLAALRDQRIEVNVDVDRGRLDMLRGDLAALGNERVHVDVDVDRGGLDLLRADLASIRDRRVRITTAVDQAGLSTLRAQLAALRNQEVAVRVDTDRAQLDALRAALAALTDETVRVDVDVDDSQLTALQASLTSLANRTVRIDVDAADTTGTAAQLDALARNRNIVLDVELRGVGPATAMLAGLSSRTLDVDLRISNAAAFETQLAVLTRPRHINISLGLNSGDLARITAMLAGLRALGSGGGGGAGGISAIGGAASSAVGPVLMLTAATLGLGAAAGAGPLVLAAAFGTVAAAAGAMATAGTLGLTGFMGYMAVLADDALYDKMIANTDKVKQSFTEIAERAVPAMGRLFDALPGAFDRMAPSIERITDGAANMIDKLTAAMPSLADSLGPMLERAFGAGVPHMDNMLARLPQLTDAFGGFFDSLADPRVVDAADRAFGTLPGIIEKTGDAIAGTAGAFNGLMGWLDSGAIDGFTEGWSQMVDSITGADWSGTVDSIAGLANSFGDLMGSVDGQGLADSLTDIATAAKGLNDGLGAASSGLEALFDKIGATDATRALAQDLGDIAEEIEMWENLFAGRGYKTNIEIEAELDVKYPDWGDDGIQAAIDSMTQGNVYGAKFEVQPEPIINPGGLEDIFGGLGPVPVPVKPEVEGNPLDTLLGPLLDGEGLPVPITPVFEAGSFESLLSGLNGNPEIPVIPKIAGDVTPESLLGGLLGGAAVPIPVTPQPAAGVTPESLFGALGPVPVPVTPQVSPGSLESLFGVGAAIPVPVEPTLQGSSLESLLAPLLNAPPVPVAVEPAGDLEGKIHGMAAGISIEVPVTVSERGGGFDKIKQMKADPVVVPIVYGQMPPLEIPQPPPVQVDVQTNADQALSKIKSIPTSVVTKHLVETNVAAVAAQIDSLNGRDTSSTHTIHITESGGSRRMANGGIRSFADGGFSKLPSGARIQSTSSQLIQWAEPETHGEAFIPLAPSKRTRSLAIWEQTGTLLGAWDRMFDSGAAMVEGLIAGMDSQRGKLEAAARELSTEVRGAFAADITPRIGIAGAYDMNQRVEVFVEAGTAADPVTVGREITDYLDAYVHASGKVQTVRANA